jgi:hypothetical protein
MGGIITIILGLAAIGAYAISRGGRHAAEEQHLTNMVDVMAKGEGGTRELLTTAFPQHAMRKTMYGRLWVRYPLILNGARYEWSSANHEGVFVINAAGESSWFSWKDIKNVGIQLQAGG